ncbi:MAG: hypothetical protein ABSA39_20300 [Edaphobacter sp.]
MLKKKLIYLLPVLSAILIVGGSKAQAQITDGLKVKIPFEFHVGKTTLPAGNYTINVVNVESNLIQIRSDNGHSVLVQTMDAEPSISKTFELLFDHTGEDYYLERIYGEYGDSSVELIDAGYVKK